MRLKLSGCSRINVTQVVVTVARAGARASLLGGLKFNVLVSNFWTAKRHS